MPPIVVALAWDALTPEGRALAHRAATTFIKARQPSELVGVFLVDQALRTVEGYTTDSTRLTAAVDQISGMAATNTGRERSTQLSNRVASPGTPVTAGAEHAPP